MNMLASYTPKFKYTWQLQGVQPDNLPDKKGKYSRARKHKNLMFTQGWMV